MAAQLAKTRKETAIEKAKETADEIGRIRLDAEKKIFDKTQDYQAQSDQMKRARGAELQAQLSADIQQINAERDRKIADVRYKQYLKELELQAAAMQHQEELDKQLAQKKIDAELSVYREVSKASEEVKFQKDLLELQMQMIGATEKQKNIAEERLRIEKEIAEWKLTEQFRELSDKDKLYYEGLKRGASEAKIANMELAESLKYMQGMYDALWGSMSRAIENFVRTGKFSIKDFTRSVIQDMLIMNMKLQAMTLIRGLLGSLFAKDVGILPGDSPLSATSADIMGRRASGGPVSAGSPYLVGERGPEVFMPSGSGTIIPNSQLGSMSGTTNVTNNYINAIDTKSFEDRILGSSSAIWAANAYAQKSLAVGRGRA